MLGNIQYMVTGAQVVTAIYLSAHTCVWKSDGLLPAPCANTTSRPLNIRSYVIFQQQGDASLLTRLNIY